MNRTRTAVPSQPTKERHPARRVAQAVALFAVAALGAAACSDSSVTGPAFRPDVPESYDSTTPPELKAFNQPADVLAALAPSLASSPLLSASAASAAAAAAYSASKIDFAPIKGNFKNVLAGCDDCFLGPFDIGFSFQYFGKTYSKFYISTNGFVAFSPIGPDPVDPRRKAGCCEGQSIPLADHVNDVIAIAWGDLDTRGVVRGLSYETRGDPGSRQLIVNFAGAKDLNDGSKPVTAQLILHEGSNVIDVHTTRSGNLKFRNTQGVENASGTEAAFLTGRVAAKYVLSNDAVRFAPTAKNADPVALPGGNAGAGTSLRYEGVEGTPVEFKGSGTDADKDSLRFAWDFDNDGKVDAEVAEAPFTFVDNGSFKAKLIVKDGRGGVAEALVNVEITNAEPVVNAGLDVRVNAGETVSFAGGFSDKGVKDAPWSWSWDFGSLGLYSDRTESQAAAVLGSKRFCKAGSFPAKLTVVDKDAGLGSDELVVTVDALSVQIDVDPDAINLNAGGHGMVTVRIFSRDGLDATTLNPNVVKLTNGSGEGTQLARVAGGRKWHWSHEDLNGDGRLDVVAGFRRDELIANRDLTASTTQLTLSSEVGNCGDVVGTAPVSVKTPGGAQR